MALSDDITAEDEDIRKLQLELNTKELQYRQAKELLDQRQKAYDHANLEGSEIDNEKNRLKHQLEQIDGRSKENIAKNKKCKNQITELTEELEQKKKKRSVLHESINQLSLNLIAYSQTEGFIDEKLARNTGEINRINDEVNTIRDTRDSSADNIKAKEASISAVKEAITGLNNETVELSDKITALEKSREQLVNEQKEALSLREKLADVRNELEKEQIRLQNQNEKLQNSFDALNQYMWNEYELTYIAAQEFRSDITAPYTELKADTKELKQQIKALGEVNVNSIDITQ